MFGAVLKRNNALSILMKTPIYLLCAAAINNDTITTAKPKVDRLFTVVVGGVSGSVGLPRPISRELIRMVVASRTWLF